MSDEMILVSVSVAAARPSLSHSNGLATRSELLVVRNVLHGRKTTAQRVPSLLPKKYSLRLETSLLILRSLCGGCRSMTAVDH